MRWGHAAAGALAALALAAPAQAAEWPAGRLLEGSDGVLRSHSALLDAATTPTGPAIAWITGDADASRLVVRAPDGTVTPLQAGNAEAVWWDVAIASHPAGGTLVAWSLGNDVIASFRPPGGSFSAPITLATGRSSARLDAAMGPTGRGLVAWGDADGVRATTIQGGAVATRVLSERGPAAGLRVASAPDGSALVTWSVGKAGHVSTPDGSPVSIGTVASASISSAVRRGGDGLVGWVTQDGRVVVASFERGALGTARRLARTGQSRQAPSIEFGPNGNALFGWSLRASTGNDDLVRVIERTRSGRFGRIRTLEATKSAVNDVVVGYGPRGLRHVAWVRVALGPPRIISRTLLPGGRMCRRVPLSRGGDIDVGPLLAGWFGNRAFVVWPGETAADYGVFMAVRPPNAGC